jgi:hypothetical protein
MVVGLIFHPAVHINGVRQHGEDRKFLIALLTKYAVAFDCRHNRMTPYVDIDKFVPVFSFCSGGTPDFSSSASGAKNLCGKLRTRVYTGA